MLNKALMCNLSLGKHSRSWPTLGVNATDLSYTSEAQLEEEGKKGLFKPNFISIGLYVNAWKLMLSVSQTAGTHSEDDKTKMHFIE